MSAHSRDEVPVDFEMEGVLETRKTDAGGMTFEFGRAWPGADATEMFAELPDGACQEQHWGYITKGSLKVRYTDGSEETYAAGQAYYMKPGHVPSTEEGAEWIEFTPADQSPDQQPPPGA